jgi:hypothetical protein
MHVQLGDACLHLKRGAARTEAVVLARDRHTEDTHDRVADELLDRSPVPLEGGAHLGEVETHQLLQRLRVDALPERGRADEVAEHERRQPPSRRDGRAQRRTAVAAVQEPAGVLTIATRAVDARHGQTIGRDEARPPTRTGHRQCAIRDSSGDALAIDSTVGYRDRPLLVTSARTTPQVCASESYDDLDLLCTGFRRSRREGEASPRQDGQACVP